MKRILKQKEFIDRRTYILQYETAKKLYEEIKTKSMASPIEDFDEFYMEFLQDATDYANNRLAGALWIKRRVRRMIVQEASSTMHLWRDLMQSAEF